MSEVSGKEFFKKIPVPVLSFILGAGIGLAVESHTDTVARRKVITAEACMKSAPIEDVITPKFESCVEEGVPGGTKIGSDKFDAGDPAINAETYVTVQQSEDGLEADRVIIWGVAGAVIGLSDIIL